MSIPPPPNQPPRKRPASPGGSDRPGRPTPGKGPTPAKRPTQGQRPTGGTGASSRYDGSPGVYSKGASADSGTGPAAGVGAAAATTPTPVRKGKKVRKARTGWRRWLPTWRMIWVTCLSGFLLVVAGIAYLWFSTPLPNEGQVLLPQTTRVLYSDGSTLGTIGATHRESVPLSKVPLVVRRAVLAAEDRKFYHEPGISITGIGRAVLVDLAGGHVQGGSTITQQYAKNAFLTQKRTLSRKLREVVIAEKLDQKVSKDKILEAYLNTIYFGRGASGIQAASKAYFGKDVSKLDAAEGAVLAALVQRPSYLDPLVHKDAAVARWHYVINGMIKEKWLDAVPAYPKDVIKYVPQHVTGPNAFIIDAVQKELSGTNGFDDQQLASGVTIQTTIDKADQAAAIKAEDDQLNSKVASLKTKNPPVSALYAMQPSDGAVRAMYGGQGATASGSCAVRTGGCVNLATQGSFQPGSSMKPYVLAASEESGGPGILSRMDGPAVIKDPPGPDVHNDSGEVCHNCDLAKALAQSINTIYVPLAKQIKPQTVADLATKSGVTSPLNDHGQVTDRIALGVYDVHPYEQAVGYGTLCNNGRKVKPFLVRWVKNRAGEKTYSFNGKSQQVIVPDVVKDVDYAMQQVVQNGTATGAQLGNRPVAGKTGTTQNNTNAWFIGCTAPAKGTGQLVTAVWMGHAAGFSPLTDIPGFSKGVFGGQIPAAIFKQFMTTAMDGKKVVQFDKPAYYTGPKPASTVTTTPTTLSPTPTTPTPTKTTASPKATKTTKPPVVTTAPTTTTAAPTTTQAPPSTGAPPTTTAAPTTTTAPPAAGGTGGQTQGAAAGQTTQAGGG